MKVEKTGKAKLVTLTETHISHLKNLANKTAIIGLISEALSFIVLSENQGSSIPHWDWELLSAIEVQVLLS